MKSMKKALILTISFAVVGLLSVPSMIMAYTTIGGSLGIGTGGNGYQRDNRIWNNFTDAAANNNTTPESNHPGALGASLAVWKASEGWNSNVASASKNFDFDWQGETTNNNSNQNTMSEISGGGCGGGVLAYTETPISDGWRIFNCSSWTWSDGPGSPGAGQIDIQGVHVHELGHGLGLGHAQSGFCSGGCSVTSTMCPSICGSGTSARDIAPDDANGLQAIYGAKPGNKPLITGLSGSFQVGGSLTIAGTNFAATVNVKFTANTSQNTGTIPGTVYGVSSSGGGTQVVVTIPSGALDGNVFVWQPSSPLLSNPFPIDIGQAPPVPPVITNVSPANVEAFQGATITLTGSGFSNATQVNSGSSVLVPGQFTIVNDTQITYPAPNATALGLTTVNVTNPNGTSNNGTFTYVETNPPRLSNPAIAIGGANFTWQFGGGAGNHWFLKLAVDPTTFPYGGYNLLLNSFGFGQGFLNGAGIGSTATIIGLGFSGVTFYSQVWTLDEVSGVFTGATNITTALIL